MRCESCGARNGPGARWCGLCHEPFGLPAVTPSGPAPTAPAARDATTALPPPATPAERVLPPPPPALRRTPDADADARFRTGDGGLEWACGRCARWSPLEAQRCTACGAGFGALLDAGEAPAVPALAETGLVLGNLLLPGTALYRLGRRGVGGGIAVLYVLFAGGAAALLSSAGGAGRALLSVAPLVLGALVLLAGSTLDALNVRRGGARVLLDSRQLLWLTVGVLGLVTVLFLAAALTATR